MQLLICALILTTLTWLCKSNFHYGWRGLLGSSSLHGTIAGLIYGDVETGILLGASVNILFLGLQGPGGTMAADPGLAATIMIPAVLSTGMPVDLAVAIAVPAASLGPILWTIKKMCNATFLTIGDKAADNCDLKLLWRCSVYYPLLSNLVVYWIPVFIMIMIAPSLAEVLLSMIPTWLVLGLDVACGMLPAMGFAQILTFMGKPKFFAFFFMGYFMTEYLMLPMVGGCIFACLVGILYYTLTKKEA